MIIIAGWLEFDSESTRDAVVAAGQPHQAATRADEPGCLEYSFAADSGKPTRVQIFELWQDEPSLAAHFQHPNYFTMREVLGSYNRTGMHVLKYRIDLAESVYDNTFTPRADFFTAP